MLQTGEPIEVQRKAFQQHVCWRLLTGERLLLIWLHRKVNTHHIETGCCHVCRRTHICGSPNQRQGKANQQRNKECAVDPGDFKLGCSPCVQCPDCCSPHVSKERKSEVDANCQLLPTSLFFNGGDWHRNAAQTVAEPCRFSSCLWRRFCGVAEQGCLVLHGSQVLALEHDWSWCWVPTGRLHAVQ